MFGPVPPRSVTLATWVWDPAPFVAVMVIVITVPGAGAPPAVLLMWPSACTTIPDSFKGEVPVKN
ncbi:hypothetical protein [Nocardia jejuensis]|uniref:hypothetical protein n=1 Tax=Nocardia jejuensis TaxID=328049 RepID=UPI0012FAAD84|nr:hypothetical protein [Nocardia jejuensis]